MPLPSLEPPASDQDVLDQDAGRQGAPAPGGARAGAGGAEDSSAEWFVGRLVQVAWVVNVGWLVGGFVGWSCKARSRLGKCC